MRYTVIFLQDINEKKIAILILIGNYRKIDLILKFLSKKEKAQL